MLTPDEIRSIAERVAEILRPTLAPPAAPLLTKAELAQAWRVTPATIDRMVRRGMPVERVTNDAPRFDRAACDAWRRTRPLKLSKRPELLEAPPGVVVTLDGVRPLGGRRRRA